MQEVIGEIAMLASRRTPDSNSPNIVLNIVVGVAVVGLLFWAAYRSFKKQRAKQEASRRDYGTTEFWDVYAVSGLPVPDGARLVLYNQLDNILFRRDNQEWKIPKRRVLDLIIARGSQIRGSSQLNASAAVAGWLVAGLPGAVVAQMASDSLYMGIEYQKADGGNGSILVRLINEAGIPRKLEKEMKLYKAGRQTETTTL